MTLTIRTFLGVFFLALMTSVSAQTFTIQSNPAGGVIKLNDSSIWRVETTTSLNIPCMPCYVNDHWVAGDKVELQSKNGAYGAYTHTLQNYKDGVKAYLSRMN